ncbi:MAG TPA: DUF2141 domain-containing protein [Sphingomonadaceae bacterium]|nr:DUF2141 domain-containing protein [Sphingomonadaceae bacterium]
MSNLMRPILFASLAFAAPAVLPGQAAGAEAAQCTSPSGAALMVDVRGFKKTRGDLRVQVYGSDPAQFVKGGKRIARIDMPVRSDPMQVCVPLPAPGRYAVAVRHDINGDGKGGMSDGGGFSRNPGISVGDAIARRMPPYEEVAINVGPSVKKVDIVLQYMRGLFSIGPVKSGDR